MTPTLHVQVVINILSRDLDNLSKWLIINKLTLNTTKTVFVDGPQTKIGHSVRDNRLIMSH